MLLLLQEKKEIATCAFRCLTLSILCMCVCVYVCVILSNNYNMHGIYVRVCVCDMKVHDVCITVTMSVNFRDEKNVRTTYL